MKLRHVCLGLGLVLSAPACSSAGAGPRSAAEAKAVKALARGDFSAAHAVEATAVKALARGDFSAAHAAEATAVKALARGDFSAAHAGAEAALRDDPRSARAALVRALTRSKKTMLQFALDARTLIASTTIGGVNHRDLAASLREEGLHLGEVTPHFLVHPSRPPNGYLDVGRMLAHPKDIVLDVRAFERFENADDAEGWARSVLGEYYRPKMKASALPRRLERMMREVESGNESLERKLRYLFWIN